MKDCAVLGDRNSSSRVYPRIQVYVLCASNQRVNFGTLDLERDPQLDESANPSQTRFDAIIRLGRNSFRPTGAQRRCAPSERPVEVYDPSRRK
jgi:hypothetical protein